MSCIWQLIKTEIYSETRLCNNTTALLNVFLMCNFCVAICIFQMSYFCLIEMQLIASLYKL